MSMDWVKNCFSGAERSGNQEFYKRVLEIVTEKLDGVGARNEEEAGLQHLYAPDELDLMPDTVSRGADRSKKQYLHKRCAMEAGDLIKHPSSRGMSILPMKRAAIEGRGMVAAAYIVPELPGDGNLSPTNIFYALGFKEEFLARYVYPSKNRAGGALAFCSYALAQELGVSRFAFHDDDTHMVQIGEPGEDIWCFTISLPIGKWACACAACVYEERILENQTLKKRRLVLSKKESVSTSAVSRCEFEGQCKVNNILFLESGNNPVLCFQHYHKSNFDAKLFLESGAWYPRMLGLIELGPSCPLCQLSFCARICRYGEEESCLTGGVLMPFLTKDASPLEGGLLENSIFEWSSTNLEDGASGLDAVIRERSPKYSLICPVHKGFTDYKLHRKAKHMRNDVVSLLLAQRELDTKWREDAYQKLEQFIVRTAQRFEEPIGSERLTREEASRLGAKPGFSKRLNKLVKKCIEVYESEDYRKESSLRTLAELNPQQSTLHDQIVREFQIDARENLEDQQRIIARLQACSVDCPIEDRRHGKGTLIHLRHTIPLPLQKALEVGESHIVVEELCLLGNHLPAGTINHLKTATTYMLPEEVEGYIRKTYNRLRDADAWGEHLVWSRPKQKFAWGFSSKKRRSFSTLDALAFLRQLYDPSKVRMRVPEPKSWGTKMTAVQVVDALLDPNTETQTEVIQRTVFMRTAVTVTNPRLITSRVPLMREGMDSEHENLQSFTETG